MKLTRLDRRCHAHERVLRELARVRLGFAVSQSTREEPVYCACVNLVIRMGRKSEPAINVR